jgi:predicted HNH restriction endonuclease
MELGRSKTARISAGKAWFNMTSRGGVYFVGKRALYSDLFMFEPGQDRHVVFRPGITSEMALAAIGSAGSQERRNAVQMSQDAMGLREGSVMKRLSKSYVRDQNARRQCIAKYGTKCFICKFSFRARYGRVADGFIHVHHVRPLSDIGEEHSVDPVKDLRPVCPNCHAVLHMSDPPYSIEEVSAFLVRKPGDDLSHEY